MQESLIGTVTLDLLLTIFALSAGFQLRNNIGNTGNQNHPDLEVRVVVGTFISNIDVCKLETMANMQLQIHVIYLCRLFHDAESSITNDNEEADRNDDQGNENSTGIKRIL